MAFGKCRVQALYVKALCREVSIPFCWIYRIQIVPVLSLIGINIVATTGQCKRLDELFFAGVELLCRKRAFSAEFQVFLGLFFLLLHLMVFRAIFIAECHLTSRYGDCYVEEKIFYPY